MNIEAAALNDLTILPTYP